LTFYEIVKIKCSQSNAVMEILNTIIPIFVVILLGWAARLRGFLQPEFLGPANQLVYHLAIPALILLASPTATVTYVMARELHGDAEFAGAAISASTSLSALSFVFWLKMAGCMWSPVSATVSFPFERSAAGVRSSKEVAF
jgi:predicted permease